MSLKTWARSIRERRRIRQTSEAVRATAALREFVYLDALSLHSLLVSQKSTIPENVSEAITRADEAELKASIAADAFVGKGEIAGRYQTSNSNSVQSSRKAIIQTLFKEFRDLPLDFKLSAPETEPAATKNVESIGSGEESTAVWKGEDLRRGDLVEVEVTLAVDPVFKLGAMMTEWTAMADEYPGMFGVNGTLGFLRDAQPIMKVLDRFLAGLIPVRATATNHVVVEIEGQQFVVRKSVVEGLGLKTKPLRIVGVTEHLGYWRDVRRVLFSAGRFTMLCRIARDGIHDRWTPVKLADLFSEVAPDFVDQINAIKAPSATDAGTTSTKQGQHQLALAEALSGYKDALVLQLGTAWPTDADAEFSTLLARLQAGTVSATTQRRAFDSVRTFVADKLAVEVQDANADLAARSAARTSAGLELFPSLAVTPSPEGSPSPKKPVGTDERMLDVEVIAIYW